LERAGWCTPGLWEVCGVSEPRVRPLNFGQTVRSPKSCKAADDTGWDLRGGARPFEGCGGAVAGLRRGFHSADL